MSEAQPRDLQDKQNMKIVHIIPTAGDQQMFVGDDVKLNKRMHKAVATHIGLPSNN
jgi:hypothetical protein